MQNTQAVTIARILVNEICFKFSPPQCLLSDLGSNFISEVVKETCNLFGIERIYTSPYHPQTDGLLEKFHSTLGKNLSMYVARDHKDWDLYVRGICYGYNTSICTESTQYSPFYLMFGREPYSPLDTILPSQRNVPNTVSEYALQLAHAREVAKQNIADTQERIKMRYDETSNYKPLEPGELVWIFFPEINVGGSPKLFHNWSGPYLLLQKISPTNFKVAQADNLKPLKNPIHVNRMKRFHHRAIVPPMPDDLSSLQEDHPAVIDDLTSMERRRIGAPSPRPNMILPEPLQKEGTTTPKLDQLVDVELPDPPVLSTQADSQNDDDTSPEYEINKIIKGRYNKEGNVEYLIDWKGYPVSARTYEPLENLNETAREFVRTHDIPIQGKKPRDH